LYFIASEYYSFQFSDEIIAKFIWLEQTHGTFGSNEYFDFDQLYRNAVLGIPEECLST
jgi:hypothetical protein